MTRSLSLLRVLALASSCVLYAAPALAETDAGPTAGDATATTSDDASTSSDAGGGATGGSCKDKCGKFIEADACHCDAECAKYKDCCSDYGALCGSTGGGGTGGGAGSCKGKCGVYDQAATCQCDPACQNPKYNDCCKDAAELCFAPPGAKGSCAGTQCDGYGLADGKIANCVCDPKCEEDGSCCEDYTATCGEGSCKDVKCDSAAKVFGKLTNGDNGSCRCDDACGKLCCADKKQFCPGAPVSGSDAGSTAGDAGTAKDTGSADTGAKADAGVIAPAPSTASTAKSSGCTAGNHAGGSAGLWWVLTALAGVVVLRRRFA